MSITSYGKQRLELDLLRRAECHPRQVLLSALAGETSEITLDLQAVQGFIVSQVEGGRVQLEPTTEERIVYGFPQTRRRAQRDVFSVIWAGELLLGQSKPRPIKQG